jgi:hypothetical protein
MVQLICLILGIVYVRRKGRLRRLQLPVGSGVSTQTFELWRSAEVKSINCFLWASWGTFAVGVALIPIIQAVGEAEMGD